jgi:hypothetical protein
LLGLGIVSGRAGRAASPSAVVIEVKAIAYELPATRAVPLGRWSLAELREEVITTGLIDQVSVSTLWRWLDEDARKPWRHRSWIFPRDPDFAAKAGVVLDLYARRFQGRRLEPGEFVVSADEKTSIQARCRCHPTLLPGHSKGRDECSSTKLGIGCSSRGCTQSSSTCSACWIQSSTCPSGHR